LIILISSSVCEKPPPLGVKCALRLRHQRVRIKFLKLKMRITVEIDEKALRRIQKLTGQKKKSPAVTQAIQSFIRQQERRALVERALSGQTDFSLTNDDLEARDVDEAH
jgi:Arc/MetJ family transcription regulator